jgi:hypothetical protein
MTQRITTPTMRAAANELALFMLARLQSIAKTTNDPAAASYAQETVDRVFQLAGNGFIPMPTPPELEPEFPTIG